MPLSCVERPVGVEWIRLLHCMHRIRKAAVDVYGRRMLESENFSGERCSCGREGEF